MGNAGLIAAGISVGDVATLFTLGTRIGNWVTAEKGDRDLLGMLEEDEHAFLERRGLVGITRFQKRWDCRLQVVKNGKLERVTGKSVERLLSSSSQWTVVMTCIAAALDEFASSAMGQLRIGSVLLTL
ncbi:hypothetical protein OQA88_11837 [Cercophora sp. LCS_1]